MGASNRAKARRPGNSCPRVRETETPGKGICCHGPCDAPLLIKDGWFSVSDGAGSRISLSSNIHVIYIHKYTDLEKSDGHE